MGRERSHRDNHACSHKPPASPLLPSFFRRLRSNRFPCPYRHGANTEVPVHSRKTYRDFDEKLTAGMYEIYDE
jgi:hypothetical protein